LRPGAAWDTYRPALADALAKIAAFGLDALVVSLGVDTFERDPISRFKLKSEDYLRIGELISTAGRCSSWKAATRWRRSGSTRSTC